MKKGICRGCNDGEEKILVNAHFKLCDKCNRDRLKEKQIVPKKKYHYVRKATGEKELFLEIWEERADADGNHRCKYCDRLLGEEPLANYFSHRRAKSLGKKLRLNKDNIDLVCLDCHDEHEFQKKKE
jgi:hypothetical protein